MSATASISGRSNVLRARIEELDERERGLLEALQQVRAQQKEAREQLADAERARVNVDRTGGPGVKVADETWRRVVRELGTFTTSELRAELGVTAGTASAHVKAMIAEGIVKPDGKAMGKPLFSYIEHRVPEAVAPAPEAVEAIREHRRQLVAVPEPERGAPVSGTGRGMTVANKDVRQACEEAQRRGWKLQKKGDGHFVLVKDARRVPVAGTPSNPGASADIIRRMTRER